MLRSKLNSYNLLLQGLFFIVLGFLFFTKWQALWAVIYVFLTLGFLYLGVSQLITLGFRRKHPVRFSAILSLAANFAIVVYALSKPRDFLTFIPYVIGWWALVNGIVQTINFYVYRRDCLRGTGWRFVLALITWIMAAVLILFPAGKLRFLSRLAGSYLIFYGVVTVIETMKDLLSPWIKRRLLKHMSLSVPIVISALIPQRVFFSIRSLAKTDKLETADPQEVPKVDLEVFIYLSASGPESLGHVDVSYHGQIYSYGCHDPENRRLGGTLGDGVLIIAERNAFLKHALAGEHKTIISYGIVLNDRQKQVIEKRIDEMLQRSVCWQPEIQRPDGNPLASDYASRVAQATQAKMVKFKNGKFRTYFVFSTNCVLLADHLLRCPQLDLFNFTGIVTPGSYLSFLNDEYCRSGSIVTTRTIFRRNEG